MSSSVPLVSEAPLPLARPRRRSPRRLAAGAAALTLGAVALFAGKGLLAGEEAAPSYVTEPVVRGDVVARVTATGTLSPVVTVEVGSQVSGRIAELGADYNSVVKEGDVIARIDPELFESAVQQAKARLSAARADHSRAVAVAENAKAQHARVAELAATGSMSKAEADAALADQRSAAAQVKSAAAQVTLAKAALEQAQTNLEYTTIRSPISGVVIARSVDVGQTVAASLSAPTLFLIAEDLRKMEVHTSVAESDVGQLAAGMPVEFTVDAYPGKTFAGEVKQVRYEAATVSNVVTYDAVVAVENDELLLRPGMTATVSFITDAREDVLAVPTKAFTYRPEGARPGRRGDGRVLWVLRGGEPVPVRVTAGLSDGGQMEIAGGALEEGDLVIVGDDASAGARPAPEQRRGRRGRRGPF